MKKLGKVIKFLFILFILFLIILTIGSKLAENEITDFVTRKVSESIEAPIIINDASFNLIRRFPLSTVEFEGITFGASYESQDSSSIDTIANIEHLYISVRSKELMKKKIEIVKIEIKGADINYFVDSSGRSNIDFLIDTTSHKDTTKAAPLNLALNQLLLKDIKVNYSDEKLNAHAVVTIPDIKITGAIKDEKYEGTIKGMLTLSDCSFKDTPVNKMQLTKLNMDLGYRHDSIQVDELEITTDGANVTATGNLFIKENIPANLSFTGSELDIKTLLKYAPTKKINDLGLKNLDGLLSLDANINGELLDSVLPEINANLILKNGTARYKEYPTIKNIYLKGDATNGFLRNSKTTQINLPEIHLETTQSEADLSVSLQNLDNLKYKLNSKLHLSVDEFKEFIPDTVLQDINGNLVLEVNTDGELPDSVNKDFVEYVMQHTQANLSISNLNFISNKGFSVDSLYGSIHYLPNKISIKEVELYVPDYEKSISNFRLEAEYAGSIFDTKNLSVKIGTFMVQTPQSMLKTTLNFENLMHPSYSLSSHLSLNLDEVKPFVPDTLITDIKGKLVVNLNSEGVIDPDSISKQITDLVFNHSNLKLNLNNLSVVLPDTLMNTQNLSGNIALLNGVVGITKMKGVTFKIPWGIDSTTIANLYQVFMLHSKDTLKVDTRVQLGDLSYTAFAPFFVKDTTNIETTDNEENTKEKLNPLYEIKGKIRINSVTYEKARLDNVSTLFKAKNDSAIADQLKFEAFEGRMNSSVMLVNEKNNTRVIWMKNKIDSMNISKLLFDFNNFSQFGEPSITSDQLRGHLSTNLQGKFVLIDSKIITDSIKFKGGLKLENGGLYNFEPAIEAARETDIDDFKNITFKTLKSEIFIFNNFIYVPKTDINTSVYNVTAYGKQSFKDEYEYHIRIYLGEALWGKTKRIRKKQADLGEFKDYEDTGLKSLFIRSYKLKGDKKSKTTLDTKESQGKMNRELMIQGGKLKVIFYPDKINYNTHVSD